MSSFLLSSSPSECSSAATALGLLITVSPLRGRPRFIGETCACIAWQTNSDCTILPGPIVSMPVADLLACHGERHDTDFPLGDSWIRVLLGRKRAAQLPNNFDTLGRFGSARGSTKSTFCARFASPDGGPGFA